MINNEDLTLEIPAADVLTPDQLRELPPVEAKPEKKKAAAAPEKKDDPREAEFLASKEALRKATEDRNRMEQELAAERTRADTERTRATQLEKDVHKRTGQALYANGEATYREHQAIVGAIQSAKNETAQAKRDLEQALADDNLDARDRGKMIADAQERIALASADLRSLEEGKSTLESRLADAKARMEAHYRAAPATETREDLKQQPATTQTQADPFETYVAGFPKPTQDWMRAHPEYVKDPKLNKRLVAASFEWDADDKPMHTQEFIDSLNAKFFKQKEAPVTKADEEVETDDEAEEVELEAAPEVKKPAKSAPAAPVSRSGSPGKPSDKRNMKVSLNPSEVEHALQMFGPGTKLNLGRDQAMERYGRNKLKAEADGKYLPR